MKKMMMMMIEATAEVPFAFFNIESVFEGEV